VTVREKLDRKAIRLGQDGSLLTRPPKEVHIEAVRLEGFSLGDPFALMVSIPIGL